MTTTGIPSKDLLQYLTMEDFYVIISPGILYCRPHKPNYFLIEMFQPLI